MIEDYHITRYVGSSMPDQIHWSKDGNLLIIFKKDLMLLKPKREIQQPITKLKDIYTSTGFSGSLLSWENYIMSVACNNEVVRVGQSKRHAQGLQNDNNLTEVAFSEQGIISSGESLITAVTDSFNGYIIKEVHGELKLICLLNQYIAEDNSVDISKILKMDQLSEIRIHSIAWTQQIDQKLISPPIWPIIPENIFVVLTESPLTYFYTIDSNNHPVKLTSFDTGLKVEKEDDEYGRKALISEWIDERNGTLVSYLAILTTYNRIVIKRLTFCGSTFAVDDHFNFEEDSSDGAISILKFKKVGNSFTILSVVSTNRISFVVFDSKGVQQQIHSHLFGIKVQFNSIAQGLTNRKGDDHTIFHTLLSDEDRDLIHLKLDLPSLTSFKNCGPIYGNSFNYRKKIDSDELPIFDKLNELLNDSVFRILSISIDPSESFLGLLTSKFDPTQSIDGRIVSHHSDVSFSIIPFFSDLRSPMPNSEFNSVQYSPNYMIQRSRLFQCFSEEIKSVDKPSHSEKLVIRHEYSAPSKCLQANLYLSPESERTRTYNIYHRESMDNSNQKLLANLVVEFLHNKQVSMTTSYDQLLYLQYLRLINGDVLKAQARTGKVEIEIPGMNGIKETFSLDKDKQISSQIESEEGHVWKVCDLTLLPLMTPKVKICETCGSRVLDRGSSNKSFGELTDMILDSLQLCIHCGGRYT